MDAQVLGISVDSVPSHEHFAIECGLKKLPLLSDFLRSVSQTYGLLRPEGHSERATIIIDKQGIVRWKQVVPTDQQRRNEDILQALRQAIGETKGTLRQ